VGMLRRWPTEELEARVRGAGVAGGLEGLLVLSFDYTVS
jgi:hypothetical protein